MNRAPRVPRRVDLRWLPLATIGFYSLVSLTGCPGGADLEDPGKYGPVFAGSGNATTGGTGGAGGTGGSAGTGGSSATGGSAGAGMAGGSACNGTLTVGCDYATDLNGDCANSSGCHKGAGATGLNLVPDAGLACRLKDVTATHSGLFCGTDFHTCTSAELATQCPGTDKFVDSSDWTKSWILQKVTGMQGTCGDPMPSPPSYDATKEACLEQLVQAIAGLK